MIAVGDTVVYQGEVFTVEALYPDADSGDRPVTAVLSATGSFAGRYIGDREVGLNKLYDACPLCNGEGSGTFGGLFQRRCKSCTGTGRRSVT